MSTMVDPQKMREVAQSCKHNAPKLEAVCDQLISFCKKNGEGFPDFETLADKMTKLKANAFTPIQMAFEKTSKTLEEQADYAEKMSNSVK